MPNNRGSELDLLALAESVAAGQRSLDNVIDQIAVATPDDRERRRAVAELQSLVLALTGVRAHARATTAFRSPSEGGSAAHDLVVEPRRLVARPARSGRAAVAAGVSAIAAVVIVAVVVAASLRPSASVGGPYPSGNATAGAVASAPTTASAAASTEPSQTSRPSGAPSPVASPSSDSSNSPARTPAEPTSTPEPSRTATPTGSGFDVEALPVGAPMVALWSTEPGRITIWYWSPSASAVLRRGLAIDTWASGSFSTQVAVSPHGSRIAVTEFGGPTSSLNRTRVFNVGGQLLWTSPGGAAPAVDLVWARDGSELALGAVPGPWMVLIFSPTGQVDAIAYNVSGGNAYRLLGFAPDGAHLIGYETSGEAAFTDKPVSLDLAHGTIAFTPIDQFPAGMQSNGTTAWMLNRINPATGDVLVIANNAKGPADWVLRSNGKEDSFGLNLGWDLTWADASTVAILGAARPSVPHPTGSATGTTDYLALFTTTGPGTTPKLLIALPGLMVPGGAGGSPAGLISARDGFALVYVGAPPCCVGTGLNGYSQLLLIDVHSQHSVNSELPAGAPADLRLLFAGWIGATP